MPPDRTLGHHRLDRAAGPQAGVDPLGLQPAEAEAAILQPCIEQTEPGLRAEAGPRDAQPGQRYVAADQDQLAPLQPAGQQRGEVEAEPQAARGDAEPVGGGADGTHSASSRGPGNSPRVIGPSRIDSAAEPGGGQLGQLRTPRKPD